MLLQRLRSFNEIVSKDIIPIVLFNFPDGSPLDSCSFLLVSLRIMKRNETFYPNENISQVNFMITWRKSTKLLCKIVIHVHNFTVWDYPSIRKEMCLVYSFC